jgi:hypothetical protein
VNREEIENEVEAIRGRDNRMVKSRVRQLEVVRRNVLTKALLDNL